MAKLTKPVKRETDATVFDRSALRNLIVSIEPAGRDGALIGLRLKGSRRTYRIGVNSVYNAAINLHLQRIERKTKELMKHEGLKRRSAFAQATREMEKELKS
jgi:phosphate uptake regulator